MGEREYKSFDFTNIKAQSSGRVRVGICAVTGNIDAVGDRIMPGAFTRTLDGGAKRARFLWNHSYQHPPIAAIKELREVTRDELPAEVLAKAPNATGGLLVKREYFKTDLSDWVLEAVDADAVNEMSFAYSVVKSSRVTEPIDGNPDETQEINNLEELKLMDCSDVLWGCNSATVAAGAKNLDLPPVGAILSYLLAHEANFKAGARNATSDQKLLDLIHETAVKLGAKCMPEDDGKSGNPAETDTDETATKTDDERPEPAELSTSLAELTLKATHLHIAKLRIGANT